MFNNLIVWVQVLSEMLPISSSTQVHLAEKFAAWCGHAVTTMPKEFDYLLHLPLFFVLPIFFRSGWWQPCKMLATRVWMRERLSAWSTRQLLMKIGGVVGVVVVSCVLTAGVDYVLSGVEFAWWWRVVGLLVTAAGLWVVSLFRSETLRQAQGERREKIESKNACSDVVIPAQAGTQSSCSFLLKLQQLSKYLIVQCCAGFNLLFGRKEKGLGPRLRGDDAVEDRNCTKNPLALSLSKGLSAVSFLPLIIIGITQSLALLPGISRMGITITTALLLGLSVRRAFEISFALQFPLMFAALAFRALPWAFSANAAAWLSPQLFINLACAGVVSYAVLFAALKIFEQRLSWILAGYVSICALLLIFADILAR